MDSEKATLKQLVLEYSTAVEESSKFSFLVRDTKLQLEQIDLLLQLKNRIKSFKYGAVKDRDESASNQLFHLQCGLNAQISFLRMWTQLKDEDYYAAWDSLIDAQEYISIAMRASDRGVGLDEFLSHLRRAEEVVFPGYKLNNSCGAVIKGGQVHHMR